MKPLTVNQQTYKLFIKLNALKFKELVDFKTIQIMYRVKNQYLPNSIQRLFQMRESKYDFRGTCMFESRPRFDWQEEGLMSVFFFSFYPSLSTFMSEILFILLTFQKILSSEILLSLYCDFDVATLYLVIFKI